MITTLETEHFSVKKMNDGTVTVSEVIRGMHGNVICFKLDELNDLIQLLQKAESEF